VLQKLETVNALKPTHSNIYEVPNIFAVSFLLFICSSSVQHLLDLVAVHACEFGLSQKQDWAQSGVTQNLVLSLKKKKKS